MHISAVTTSIAQQRIDAFTKDADEARQIRAVECRPRPKRARRRPQR